MKPLSREVKEQALATKTVVTLIDDLDGSEATQTVPFSLDGVEYEIDLSDDNAAFLRETLARYVAVSRPARTRRAPKATKPELPSSGPATKAVREWAASQGIQLSPRGRISKGVLDQYLAAH